MSRALIVLFALALAGSAGADLALHPHPHFSWDGWPFFHSALGLAAPLALLGLALLLRALVGRKEGDSAEGENHDP